MISRLASLAILALLTLPARAALFDPNYRTILLQDQVAHVLQTSCDTDPALQKAVLTTWTPSNTEVDELEKHLGFALRDAIKATPWIGPTSQVLLSQWEAIANHARQYGGVVVDQHRAIVVMAGPIRFFDWDGPYTMIPPDSDAPWRTGQSVMASDIGPSAFLTLYDPQTGKFGAFHFCGSIAGYHAP